MKVSFRLRGLCKKWESSKIPTKSKPPGKDYDLYRYSLKEWTLFSLQGLGLAGLISFVFYRSRLVFFLLLPFGMLFPLYKKPILIRERKKRLLGEFKEGILALSSRLEAGYSLENAVSECIPELLLQFGKRNMIIEEFEQIARGIRINRTVEEMFSELAQRASVDDISDFARIVAVAKRRGGELIPVMKQSISVISDKIRMEEEILTMTAAKRFEQKIMNFFPIGMILFIDLSAPDLFGVMYSSAVGRLVMSLALVLYLLALYLAKRILDIEV